MGYTEAAIARRRCTGTRKDGQTCRAWARWDDRGQRCVNHAGRHHARPLGLPGGAGEPDTVVSLCGVPMAAPSWWGLCRWPGLPGAASSVAQGTRGCAWRWRGGRLYREWC